MSVIFEAAYNALLTTWPHPTRVSELPTPYGTTHLLSHGVEDGPPVLLDPTGCLAGFRPGYQSFLKPT
ncbi:hypothetical protein [Streptomyces sp. NBC_00572]|uniref:hypothetical protein n=1 Tax=Streptomyces sp. NBC_00572 TaxID=2903664 RepID=UPI00224D62D4|nr:hypothetical protein [Streptomyces sp. NBC_00572]MCX4980479.1 hypothetical protein [Streptomyces sp. NBC_00572]